MLQVYVIDPLDQNLITESISHRGCLHSTRACPVCLSPSDRHCDNHHRFRNLSNDMNIESNMNYTQFTATCWWLITVVARLCADILEHTAAVIVSGWKNRNTRKQCVRPSFDPTVVVAMFTEAPASRHKYTKSEIMEMTDRGGMQSFWLCQRHRWNYAKSWTVPRFFFSFFGFFLASVNLPLCRQHDSAHCHCALFASKTMYRWMIFCLFFRRFCFRFDLQFLFGHVRHATILNASISH